MSFKIQIFGFFAKTKFNKENANNAGSLSSYFDEFEIKSSNDVVSELIGIKNLIRHPLPEIDTKTIETKNEEYNWNFCINFLKDKETIGFFHYFFIIRFDHLSKKVITPQTFHFVHPVRPNTLNQLFAPKENLKEKLAISGTFTGGKIESTNFKLVFILKN